MGLKREQVAGIVELALQESFKPDVVTAGWKKTCLDTLDPSPLVLALEKNRAELKKSQDARTAERERLAALLQEEKDPDTQEELKAASVEAEVLEEHLDIPELPAPGRRRKTRYMPDGGILTSPAEEKRQQEKDAEADKKKRKPGRGKKRKAPRGRQPPKKRARKESAAEGKDEKAAPALEGKRQQRVPPRRPLRSKRMAVSDDESPVAAESSHNAESPSDASDEESSLTEKSDTDTAEPDFPLDSETESEAAAVAAVEEKADQGVDVVLGECRACKEPLFASDQVRQCSKCTGLLHSACAGPAAPTSRSRQQEFRCAACRRNS
ncbi:MAG: hypothetical protein KGK08_14980 [Acidobacteriota bacterium]|nr:hypothetical protein [Acidobacteriota bacterium]